MTDLPAQPERRASDADRELTAADLRDAFAEGRLDADEYQNRLDAVWQSRTNAELERLTSDLPETDARKQEDQRRLSKAKKAAKRRNDIRGYAGLAVLLVGIWLISSIASGELRYFWPIWPLGFAAIFLILSIVNGNDDDDDKGATES